MILKLEEKIIRLLEATGYADRWTKPEIGLHHGNNNYTPDLELSLQFEGMTHRAIIELKPSLEFFDDYISRRMRGSAKHYESNLLLLYVDDQRRWYRIDRKSGTLSPIDLPPPGAKPIRKLYNPVSIVAPRIYSHRYKKAFNPIIPLAKMFADLLELSVKSLFGPKRKTKRRSRRKAARLL